MFAWETAKAHQASLLEISPEVFCQIAPASERLATAFGEAAPKQKKEDRPPGEPSPVERNTPAEPKTNFVTNSKANQDLQRIDPKEPVGPKANFMAKPNTSNAAGTPRMPKRSQSLPRTTGRNPLTLSAQADGEKNKREKDALGRPPFVPPGNPGVRVPRPDGAIREDLRRQEHMRQRRSESVQNRGIWAVPSPKYEKPASAIHALLSEPLPQALEEDTELNHEWGPDIHAKPNEDERLERIQREQEKKEAERIWQEEEFRRKSREEEEQKMKQREEEIKEAERKKQQEESRRKSREEEEQKKNQQEEEKKEAERKKQEEECRRKSREEDRKKEQQEQEKEAERKKQEEESQRKLQEEKEKKKKQEEEEAARQRQQAADGKPNADDKGQPAVRDNNSNKATAKNEELAISADTVPSASGSKPPVPPTSSYVGFMTVCRLHEYYLMQSEGDVVQMPQNPQDIVIEATEFLPETDAATFAVWQSPEVAGGQALATAEQIISDYPTGKPTDLINKPKQFLDWVDGVTEIYTRQVALSPNMVGTGLEVDVANGGTACGILPRYIPKSLFRDEWKVIQMFKLKYDDMEVPASFAFPSSRSASEETVERPTS